MEILLAAVVLFVASVLVNVPPPVNTTAASAGPVASAPTGLVVEGHDYATSVNLDLTITPGIAGANTSGWRRPGENPALNHCHLAEANADILAAYPLTSSGVRHTKPRAVQTHEEVRC